MEKKINLLCLNILTKQVVGFLVTPNEISFKVKCCWITSVNDIILLLRAIVIVCIDLCIFSKTVHILEAPFF